MANPLISIIVPVYNVEKYLRPCLDSILSQTYTNWEAILVDDGSKDKSGSICDEYANKDNRVKVIHKENGGVSPARNRGLEECQGQWCCFVDSDDWLEPTYLQNFLVDGFENYGCVIQGFYKELESKIKSKQSTFPDKEIATASELEYVLENTKGAHNGYLWHRIFRVKTIKDNNLSFPIGISFAEDGVFFVNYILHSANFRMTSKIGYHHRVRGNSLTSMGKNLPQETLYNIIDLITNSTNQIIAKDKPIKEVDNGLKLYMWHLLYNWILKRSTRSKEDYMQSLDFLSHYFDKYPELKGVDGNSCCFDAMVENVVSGPSAIKYYVLRFLIRVYYVERRVRRKLNAIL